MAICFAPAWGAYLARGPAAARPPTTHVFFDCDDCCYQNEWRTAAKITDAIAGYTARLGLSKERAYALYKAHGTCLKGMLVEGVIAEANVEEFLREAHDIDYADVAADPALRAVVAAVAPPARRFVFTASTREHALRCLARVGIDDLFEGVVDTRVCGLETKHSEAAFRAAMAHAGVAAPRACMLIDDSVKNIKCARGLGWRTVLVGLTERETGRRFECAEADHHIARLHDLRSVAPDLFVA